MQERTPEVIALHEMALDALKGLTRQQRLEFCTFIICRTCDPSLVHKLEQAANEIGRHAHELQREYMPLRTDGSVIHPYAPDGGPLGDRK